MYYDYKYYSSILRCAVLYNFDLQTQCLCCPVSRVTLHFVSIIITVLSTL